LFILPALFAFVLVVLVPAVKGFYYSFTDWNGIGKNAVFVGISNYGKLLSDSRFWNSFLLTFVFAICSVICINAVGFGLPLVAPAFTIGLFLSISDSFKMFDQNLSLTAGGPANSTEMIALNIYNTASSFLLLRRIEKTARRHQEQWQY
jgi:ABC-type sugar transport system permease subunit